MSTTVYSRCWCCDLCNFKVFLCGEEKMKKHLMAVHGINCDSERANSGMCGDLFMVSDMAIPRKPFTPALTVDRR